MGDATDVAEKDDTVRHSDAFKGTAHDAAEKGHAATDQ